jgi:hypothetical protein
LRPDHKGGNMKALTVGGVLLSSLRYCQMFCLETGN